MRVVDKIIMIFMTRLKRRSEKCCSAKSLGLLFKVAGVNMENAKPNYKNCVTQTMTNHCFIVDVSAVFSSKSAS